MRFFIDIAATLFLVSLSSAAVPLPKCNVPPQIFYSLNQPFSLSILQPATILDGPFEWLPLQLTSFTPTKEISSKLVINKARSKIAPPKFVLKNQKLIAYGFPAKSLPTAEIFPRPLVPFVFGGNAILVDAVKFLAAYSCDDNNQLYLRLFADPSR